MMPREGTIIADRYRLERKVGGGRVAAMWLVRDQVTESACAVKLLHRSMNEHAEALARFSLEDRLARELTGVYFPERIGSGSWQSMRYIAWRWYEGECLRALFDRNPKQDVQTVNSIAQETCNALSMVHGAGYTHGDLKPENLFFAERVEKEREASRQLKLLGFGVASRLSRPLLGAQGRRTPGQIVGTPLYLSPELILGRVPRGGQADLWALAVIVYEALTGRAPFIADDLAGVLAAILEKQAPKPTSIADKLPGSFDLWWAQALEQGFANPAEFATSLSRALAPALRSSRTQRSASLPGTVGVLGEAGGGGVRGVSIASSPSPRDTTAGAVRSGIPRAAVTGKTAAAKQSTSARITAPVVGADAQPARDEEGALNVAAPSKGADIGSPLTVNATGLNAGATSGAVPDDGDANSVPADGVAANSIPASSVPANGAAASAGSIANGSVNRSAGPGMPSPTAVAPSPTAADAAAAPAVAVGAPAATSVGGTTSAGIAPSAPSRGMDGSAPRGASATPRVPGVTTPIPRATAAAKKTSNAALFREAVAAATDSGRATPAPAARPRSGASPRREPSPLPSEAAARTEAPSPKEPASSPVAAHSRAEAPRNEPPEAPVHSLSLGTSSTAPGIGPAAVAMIRALQNAAADAAANIRVVDPRTGNFAPLPSPLSDFASTGSRKTLVGITPPSYALPPRGGMGTASGASAPAATAASAPATSSFAARSAGLVDANAIEGAPCRPIEVSDEQDESDSSYNFLRRAGHPTVPFARPRAARRSAPRDTIPHDTVPDLDPAFELERPQGADPWTMRTTRTLRIVLTDSGHRPHLIAGLLVCGAAALVIFALGHSPMAGTGALGQSTNSLEPPAANTAATPDTATRTTAEPAADPSREPGAASPVPTDVPSAASESGRALDGVGGAEPPGASTSPARTAVPANAPARLSGKEIAPGLVVPAASASPSAQSPAARSKPDKPKPPEPAPSLRGGSAGALTSPPSSPTSLPNSQKPPGTEPLGGAGRPVPAKPGQKKPGPEPGTSPRPANGDFDFGI